MTATGKLQIVMIQILRLTIFAKYQVCLFFVKWYLNLLLYAIFLTHLVRLCDVSSSYSRGEVYIYDRSITRHGLNV